MKQRIKLAISTCPNDTYAFSGLLTGNSDAQGLAFDIELLDIEELNRRLFAGDFDAAKASFHAALYLTEETCVLPVGAALGFGVGPLLLSAEPDDSPDRHRRPRVLCPGRYTTATLLYRLFYPQGEPPTQCLFSDIMPALRERRADFGVCIHEGRFTYRAQGLHLVEDLGTRWERAVGGPLPLGGILARRRLGAQLDPVCRAIAESLRWADEHRDEALQVMRAHAAEMEDRVIWSHVELYVNEFTHALGAVGRDALDSLYARARTAGMIEGAACALDVHAVS